MRDGKRARYTLEFKQEAVRLVESGQSIAEAARSPGVVDQIKRDHREIRQQLRIFPDPPYFSEGFATPAIV